MCLPKNLSYHHVPSLPRVTSHASSGRDWISRLFACLSQRHLWTFHLPPFYVSKVCLAGCFISISLVSYSISLSLLISSPLLHFLLRVFAVRCSSPDLYILFIHTFLSSSTCAFIAALLYTLFTAFRNYHQHHHHIAGNEPTHQNTRPAQNKNYTKKQ